MFVHILKHTFSVLQIHNHCLILFAGFQPQVFTHPDSFIFVGGTEAEFVCNSIFDRLRWKIQHRMPVEYAARVKRTSHPCQVIIHLYPFRSFSKCPAFIKQNNRKHIPGNQGKFLCKMGKYHHNHCRYAFLCRIIRFRRFRGRQLQILYLKNIQSVIERYCSFSAFPDQQPRHAG